MGGRFPVVRESAITVRWTGMQVESALAKYAPEVRGQRKVCAALAVAASKADAMGLGTTNDS